jgi:UDP-glucuronate decarboxylase
LKLVNGKSKLVFQPLPVDDPLQRCPDISLARKALKWEPKVKLDDGLGKTIAYFDALLRGNEDVGRVGR